MVAGAATPRSRPGGSKVNEVTVIVGVRPSDESPDLVLVQRRLGVVDGKLEFVGELTETIVPLSVPRGKIHLSFSVDVHIGMALVGRVENTGFLPVDVTRVALELVTPDPKPDPGLPTHLHYITIGFDLIPRDRSKSGRLMPSESRDWLLRVDSFVPALEKISDAPLDRYKIVAYTGKLAFAEAPGERIKPLLDGVWQRRETAGGIRMTPAMQDRFEAMDTTIRDSIIQAIEGLQKKPVIEWAKTPGITQLNDGMYFLALPPDYQVLIRRQRQGGRQIELLDILRQAVGEGAAAGQRG
jgi:hypothetical protein